MHHTLIKSDSLRKIYSQNTKTCYLIARLHHFHSLDTKVGSFYNPRVPMSFSTIYVGRTNLCNVLILTTPVLLRCKNLGVQVSYIFRAEYVERRMTVPRF